MIILKYGNTNTFFIQGEKGGLLLDTDTAGTLPAFYRALKNASLRLGEITYVLATHYHPDHMGLIGELTDRGVRLLLIDKQTDFVHFSDGIFKRGGIPCRAIDETSARIISCRESRAFLSTLGIDGEIVPTESHSKDGIALLLDDGDCFVGDLEPYEYIGGYEENTLLANDWKAVLSHHPRRIFFSHRPEKNGI